MALPQSISTPPPRPAGTTGVLVLADGSVVWGRGFGAASSAVGEVCFNTAMTGYQEILTDPSYAGQIITFTFPHIGNVGANVQDLESTTPFARGCILRSAITAPSNYRSEQDLGAWLASNNLVGLSGVDTRRLTRLIRDSGAPSAAIAHDKEGRFDLPTLYETASSWPGLKGMDLAKDVTCRQTYSWDEARWAWPDGFAAPAAPRRRVVAIDYGAKRNILRCLAGLGCELIVVPATASAEDVMRHKPDGIFLSNGPGDPAATGAYALPVLRELIDTGLPIFGICLGHQLLALALGAKTAKMAIGHRGANHPVKDLVTGKVEITSQNHGFVVDGAGLPGTVAVTHVSLFDGSISGMRAVDRPIFSVQYHPEASPGPQDSHYLFKRFVDMIDDHKGTASAA